MLLQKFLILFTCHRQAICMLGTIHGAISNHYTILLYCAVLNIFHMNVLCEVNILMQYILLQKV